MPAFALPPPSLWIRLRTVFSIIRPLGQSFQGLSLGSVLLLAAIGLAITFGVMGVINMAHGEMIMIGAYVTFMIQEVFRSFAPEYFGLSLALAVPAAIPGFGRAWRGDGTSPLSAGSTAAHWKPCWRPGVYPLFCSRLCGQFLGRRTKKSEIPNG